MLVTAIVCTHDRARSLEQTLASLEGIVVPQGQLWELVVVDNASRDETPAVLRRMSGRLPMQAVREPRVGLSAARNTAVRAARGDLLLFTDDDVHVDRHWLAAHVAAARRWPQAAYFAGRIDPEFEAPPARWVTRQQADLAGMLCALDLGGEERRLAASEYPFGPNMAVRRSAFARAAFDERVGRRGREQVRGSETSLFLSLSRQGAWGVWVPEACVRHRVPPAHATWRYFWRYYRSTGRAIGRLEPRADGATLALRVRLWGHVALGLLGRAAARRGWIAHLRHAAYLAGLISEAKGGRRGARASG
jgi:glycosyltransferase involved in cell wall biosynthesis